MNTKIRVAALAVAATLSGAAQAALIDRGGGLIYDTDLNVTWLKDANYAQTSGYDADGRMTWGQSMTWADNLGYYDSVRGVTYTDWRLPDGKPINGGVTHDPDDVRYAHGRNVNRPRKLGLRHAQVFQYLGQKLSGMDAG